MKPSREKAWELWIPTVIGVPNPNVSLYMRRLLKTAYFDGYDLAIESDAMKERYQDGYKAGYNAKRRIKNAKD